MTRCAGADFTGAKFEQCTLNGEPMDMAVFQELTGGKGLGHQVMNQKAEQASKSPMEQAVAAFRGIEGGNSADPASLGQFNTQADLPNQQQHQQQADLGNTPGRYH